MFRPHFPVTIQSLRVDSSGDDVVAVNDRMQRGHLSILNGFGLDYPDEQGNMTTTGVAPSELTSTDLVDEFFGTAWHKSVPFRVKATG